MLPKGIALLLSAAVGITLSILHRPPATAAAAALVNAVGLLVAILLMPATRFGYLLYPVALLAWVPLLRRADRVLDRRSRTTAPGPVSSLPCRRSGTCAAARRP